ncbi:MAG: hypothetical protein CME65_12175 [Halobacteriovoraceae bacterium]|nr:hypothetical protein [Halobacteriovoraceae bacterium]|tara:strand:+ start:1546 stop:3438 length:1893 start_codon:yes stop_codon:yes gene_type:complete
MSRVKELEREIIKHKTLYYQGKPEISDYEYDRLEDELRKLDQDSSVLRMVGSSTFLGEKVKHSSKMLSLNKTYKIDELLKWKGSEEILSTFKIDGSSCSLVFEKGEMKLAKTRGDGKFGENITNKVMLIEHVPLKIEETVDFEVRGEIYCTEENFIKVSKAMQAAGFEKPTSMRNIVAGLLGRKEVIEFSRFLSFQAFELISSEFKIETETEKFLKLIDLGFQTPEYIVHNNKSSIEDTLKEAREFMTEGDYLIDGLVFSFNNLKLHSSLGETAHHPRYKMAFKFQGDTKVTTIKSISWQVSRNGILTPVGNVIPVELSGAKVSRVTLHNFGMVAQNQLKPGDRIEIVRSGEVIPKFLSVVGPSQNKFEVPTHCPSCDQEVFEEDIRLVCRNPNCPDKVKDEILNFLRKIGIEDLSTKRLEEMIKAGIIKDIPSLYELKEEQLLSLDKVKEKLANKILTNIKNSLSVDLVTFLSSLGISGGAYNKCEKVVNAGYDTLDKIMNLKEEDLIKIESFAEKSSHEFVTSLQSKKKIIEKLKSYGFDPKANIATTKSESSAIAGKKFCITGTLSMKRSEIQKIIKQGGGIVQSGVSRETDYLVTNDTESTSSKFKKAKELSIPILSEDKLLNLVE